MKKLHRPTAMFLVIILLLTMLPVTAMASLLDNSAEYNEEILNALEDMLGSENEARQYYSVMEQYGLLDEDGSLVDDLTAAIDGREYNKEELCELLSGSYDGNQLAVVDGKEITLDNLWNIIVIEGYIDYLRETYCLDGEWTEASEKRYENFLEQFSTQGLRLSLAADPSMEGEYSGVNHGAVVDFAASAPDKDHVVTVTASLSGAKEGQAVSFGYKAVSGSAQVESASGSITLTADSDGEAEKTFTVTCTPESVAALIADAPVWYLNVSDLKNARFAQSGRDAASIPFVGESTVGSGKEVDAIYGGFDYYISTSCDLNLSSGKLYAINHGIVTKLEEVKLPSISPDPMPQSTNPNSLKNIDVSYSMTADGGSTKFYSNAVKVKLENPLGPTIMYIPTVTFPANYVKSVELPRDIQNDIRCEYSTPLSSFGGHFVFSDTTAPTVKAICTPTENYTVGQTVPIVVEYSEPMKAENAFVIVNGTQVFAQETGCSDRLTFPYPVQALDSAHPVVSEVRGTDASGNNAVVYDYKPNPEAADGSLELKNAAMVSCLPQDSIKEVTCGIDDTVPTAPVLTVTLSLSEETSLTAWLSDDLDEKGVSRSLFAAVKGFEKVPFRLEGETFAGADMTASFTLAPVEAQKQFSVELYRGDEPMIGTLKYVTQAPIVFVTAGDLSAGTLVKAKNGSEYSYDNPDRPVIYVQDEPIIRAGFTLSEEKTFTFGDTAKVTVPDAGGKPTDPTAHFMWSSSDPAVANIAADGTVTPTGKAGTVYFTLTALNNGNTEKFASVDTAPLRFGVGLTPFLLIPNKEIQTMAGADVSLFWSSNIPDKAGSASFAVTVKDSKGAPIYSAVSTLCGLTIPGDRLSYDYEESADNRFTVTVSAAYGGQEYTDEAAIILSAPPAVITLDALPAYYVKDSVGSVDIDWTIRNFDRYSGGTDDLFRLYVTRNDQPVDTSAVTPGAGSGGSYQGSFAVPVSDVATGSDPTGYRDTYTVTVQARNGADSTWSYASCVFYAYDEDALKIWVNGEESSGDLTMTNVPAISKMSQDQILALKRDISLQEIVSANYGEYAWTDLSDRLSWESSDPAVSDLNYRQGSYYASISDYTYTSYRPATEFMLSGLSSGSATITETHEFTGISRSLNVSVETLKDKLYLFSCTPAVTTTAYYTNGSGEEKTVTSNGRGEFAIYEASGIAGDVYFTSSHEGFDYYGTYFSHAIASGETDPTGLNLYPCNNLVMRRAAYASVYLKNPDGSPYEGDVIVRGGVYVNGAYVETARFGYGAGSLARSDGDQDSRVTPGADGRLTVIMDSTQWGLGADGLTREDAVAYTFVVKQADSTDCYPLLIEIDASENEETYIRSGEAISAFRRNTGDGEHPFVLDSKLTLEAEHVGYRATGNNLDNTACIGVSRQIPREELTISVMWWGGSLSDADDFTMSLFTEDRYEVNEKGKTVRGGVLPFAETGVTRITVPLDTDVLKACGVSDAPKGLTLRYENVTKGLSFAEELSFRVSDTTDAPLTPDGADDMKNGLGDTMDMTSSKSFGGSYEIVLGDWLMLKLMEKMASNDYHPDKDHAGGFSMLVMPTSDPNSFIAYLGIGLSNMNNQKNVTGVYADGTADSYFSYYPGMREITWFFSDEPNATQSYWDEYDRDLNDAQNGKASTDIYYNITGYIESRLTYNWEKQYWDIKVLSGGFDAGGGIGFTQYFNTMVGPVPVTAELRGGGTVNISLDALTMDYLNTAGEIESGTEFLTQLRIYFYVKFFGGIGWDYSVIALKIGLYGQISADLTTEWLNRPDMPDGARYTDGSEMNQSKVLTGQKSVIGGQVGIEFVAKLWIFSYETAIVSKDFKLVDHPTQGWKNIDEIWSASQQHYQEKLRSMVARGQARTVNVGGSEMVMLNLAPTTESFDYLSSGAERRWYRPLRKAATLGGVSSSVELLQSNANPFTNPVLSDDGNILLYLSDGGDPETNAVHTAYALRSGSGYVDKGTISGEGGGDSGNVIAGSSDFAVAAWSRMDKIQARDAGSVVTPQDQIIMMEGSEIVASVYQNGKWTTEALTDNSSADIAPVVAVSGNRAIVAWRSVATNNIDGNAFDFNAKDTILYRVCKDGVWGETRTLYNGTSGNVKGMNAAMLPDGTAAVIYALDTDGREATTADREILWATVSADTEEVLRTVRATNDGAADENPQITVTTIDKQPRFAAAWYASETGAVSEGADEGTLSYDIHMADFAADGVIQGRLPQSLEKMIRDQHLLISSDFRFTRNSESIGDLSLVWVERRENEADSEGLTVEYDVLNALKFYTYGNDNELIGLTAPQQLARADDSTLINSFDAVSGGGAVSAVFLGTKYDPDRTETKTGQTMDGAEVSYQVPASTSALYTMNGVFTDSISVLEVCADYDSLRCGANAAVGVTVRNDGIRPVTSLTVKLGGEETARNGLYLLPGDTVTLYADYKVPIDSVRDVSYTVTAETMGGGTCSAEGTAPFGRTDLEITSARIVEEREGQRTIEIRLNNHSDAKLSGSGKTVALSFCTDPTCENPIAGLQKVIISDDASLKMIDEGGFSRQVAFNANTYLKTLEGEPDEIPEAGIPIYIKATALDGGEACADLRPASNTASVTCENLMTRTGSPVTVKSALQTAASGSTVTADVRNNRLSACASGNVIVTLFDGNGAILAQKQSYDQAAGAPSLVTIGGEKTEQLTFGFDEKGSYAEVLYTDAILDDSTDATLAKLESTNIPGVSLSLFTEEAEAPGTCAASVTVGRVDRIGIVVTPSDPAAAVTLNGEPVNGYADIPLSIGENVLDFTVTARDGVSVRHYVLTVTVKVDPEPVGPVYAEITVPVSGKEKIVNAKATVSGNTVTVRPIAEAALRKVISEDVETGTVVCDLSNPKQSITGVKLPTETVRAIAEAAAAPENDTAGLKLIFTSGTLEFDAGALETVAEAAGAAQSVEIRFDSVGTARLNAAQKAAVSEMVVVEGFETCVSVNGKRVSDFHGGSVTVCIPYRVPDGSSSAAYAVWFVAEDGTAEKQNAAYDGAGYRFAVGHFSDYVLTCDGTYGAYNNCPKDETCPAGRFSDVDVSAWYHDGVHFCVENGIMKGVSDTMFDPAGDMTRAQIVTMLWRLDGEKYADYAMTFADVPAAQWYTEAIRWAAAEKIVNGYGDGRFGTNDPVTREQLATILYRYAQYKGQGFTGAWMFLLDFVDRADVSTWADEAVHWCSMKGVVHGKDGRVFDPQGTAARAEAAAMVQRFCEALILKTDENKTNHVLFS